MPEASRSIKPGVVIAAKLVPAKSGESGSGAQPVRGDDNRGRSVG